ncbi:DEAD-box ATP-dependent RNA helicase 52C-like protein, partial [Tanacetum coccineum]
APCVAAAPVFCHQPGVKVVVAYGGALVFNHLRSFERGVDILVATLGRLTDMIERSKISLKKIKVFGIAIGNGYAEKLVFVVPLVAEYCIHMGMLNNIGERMFLQLIQGMGQEQRCLRNGEYEMANANKLILEQRQHQSPSPTRLFSHNQSNKGLYEIQKLLDALHGALPKMSLIASDFNYITDVKEPLVKEPRWFQPIYHIFDDDQLFVHGYSTDYNSYLDAKIIIIQGINLDVRDMLSSDHYVVVSLEEQLEEKWLQLLPKVY